MSSGPIRRAQLIAPFGVGAMTVVRNGTSMICAGLGMWFNKPEDIDGQLFDPNEYVIDEWRLQRLLHVSHFRLPPDYRTKRKGQNIPNCGLSVPFYRFPQWHYCPFCGTMVELPLVARGLQRCQECLKKQKRRILVQVPFIAMCERGHIQDFPWREWAHKTSEPSCNKRMRLISTGGATLAAQKVVCDCEAERSLGGITIADPKDKGGETFLSRKLDESGRRFSCRGGRPWFGGCNEPCDMPLRGSLRSAANVYYSRVCSSIYLPRGVGSVPTELITRLEEPPISTLITMLRDIGAPIAPNILRNQHMYLLSQYTDNELNDALNIVLGGGGLPGEVNTPVEGDSPETEFRRQEFNIIRNGLESEQLSAKRVNLSEYEKGLARYFSRIVLVDKLRETRALAGFSRIFPDNEQNLTEQKGLLWEYPPVFKDSWLPAYVVHGEGIYLELNENVFRDWMEKEDARLNDRIRTLVENYTRVQIERNLGERPIGARFILVHTLAHLLMNRLVFECGYSSAALRERLYVSDQSAAPMASILIYTAAGDSEGTLGGLVRMGKPGFLEPVLRRALEAARWCSADPVCMEIAEHGGQGPDSCNLAACHSCCLVPETACEEFNRFLDRGLVVGSISTPNIGFFNH